MQLSETRYGKGKDLTPSTPGLRPAALRKHAKFGSCSSQEAREPRIIDLNAMDYSNFTLYVDESGDHSLESINPEYPLFVLAFCVVAKQDYRTRIAPEMTGFKHRWFGHEAVILHAHEIRKEQGEFGFLFDRAARGCFQDDLTVLMDRLPYVLIAGAIDKVRLNRRYAIPDNPYSIAMRFCLERAFSFLREQGEASGLTHVLVESRGRKEDAALELVFRRICDGTNTFGCRLPFEVVFVDKKQNLPGLQLADLVCHPIGRHLLKPEQKNRAYEVLKKKFPRGSREKSEGHGLKTFP
uniref:DUF3800 domain-containing protein n=1 Tax=Candidatus Kentrum sp. DK TaxID=2126562 RepID=A0A450SGK6_9GAMM|nr:MAG: Protein of unknown function (DUF3800) [Candidatus Kentron sp. DK]